MSFAGTLLRPAWLLSDSGGDARHAATIAPEVDFDFFKSAADLVDDLQARRQKTWLGVVDATDEREAVEKAAVEFKSTRRS